MFQLISARIATLRRSKQSFPRVSLEKARRPGSRRWDIYVFSPLFELSQVALLRTLGISHSLVHSAVSPSGGRSGCKNFWGTPAVRITASAARYPLRTAPSIVAGQLVSVPSPARNSPRTLVSCLGLHRSTPGSGENVAATSLITVAFNS